MGEAKSRMAELVKEAALNAGKRVLVIDAKGETWYYRKKHLTLINMVAKQEHETLIIYDEYHHGCDSSAAIMTKGAT